MRLGTVTLSATLSAALLSGCSFIGGQSSNYKTPFAKQQTAQYGQYGQQGAGQRCQIATPRHPVPRGCRPEQVTIGTSGQAQYGNYGAQGGFPQQPQFGQPQYTDGAYGSAVGQTAAVAHNTIGQRKRKPKLRGSLSLGLEESISGNLLEPGGSGFGNPFAGYDPGQFTTRTTTGSAAAGQTTATSYTANQVGTSISNILTSQGPLNGLDSVDAPNISFDDVWTAPASVKAGLEYIVNDKTTVFGNVGYTYSDAENVDAGSAFATLYEHTSVQDFVGGAPVGAPIPNGTFLLDQQEVATVGYEFSDLEQFDLEVGARRYFNPIVKSDGFRTVTPFVGASVGVSRVNAISFTENQRQASYNLSFESRTTEDNFFDVPASGGSTRLADAQWIPQGQLNVGAEWQLTPGFALAAETGVRIQGQRDFEDFTNAAGDIVDGGDSDTNISIPLTLRGSINF